MWSLIRPYAAGLFRDVIGVYRDLDSVAFLQVGRFKAESGRFRPLQEVESEHFDASHFPDRGGNFRSWEWHFCQWPEAPLSCISHVQKLHFCKSWVRGRRV